MIILRNFIQSDIDQLQNTLQKSKAELETLIDTWNEKRYRGNYFEMFAIVDGTLLGQASLYERTKHIVSCGIELYPEFRGKGYAVPAYRQCLEFAKQRGYTIAVAQVLTDNIASISLHKKLGFEADDVSFLNKKGHEFYYFIKKL